VVDLICRIRAEQAPDEPVSVEMHRAINEWSSRWEELGRRAEEYLREGRGTFGYPFGEKPEPGAADFSRSMIAEVVRAFAENRRLKKGPITAEEQAELMASLNNEDAIREFCQVGKVGRDGAGKIAPLVFWRHGRGNASAVADAYRGGKVVRPWDPNGPKEGEGQFVADWVLLWVAHRKGLSKWCSVLPQVRRRIGPFLRHWSMRKAHREARASMDRFKSLGLARAVDQSIWAGWLSPAGLEVVFTQVLPLWEDLAGINRSKHPPGTW
jgi:hypothetical protein